MGEMTPTRPNTCQTQASLTPQRSSTHLPNLYSVIAVLQQLFLRTNLKAALIHIAPRHNEPTRLVLASILSSEFPTKTTGEPTAIALDEEILPGGFAFRGDPDGSRRDGRALQRSHRHSGGMRIAAQEVPRVLGHSKEPFISTIVVTADVAIKGLDLPFPTNSWFKFLIYLIAPTLLYNDPSDGMTSDMCIPVYPNTVHPAGRSPLYTEEPFPFANCYYWVNHMTYIRVRRTDGQYDDDQAVKVTPWEHVTMNIALSKDQQRIAISRGTLHSRNEEDTSTQSEPDGQDVLIPSRRTTDSAPTRQSTSSTQDSQTSAPSSDASVGGKLHAFIQDNLLQDEPATSELPPHDSPKHDPNVDAMFRMDVFGLAHDDGAEILPLVDLWYELTEHLTADTIPNPREFYEERDAIVKIVKDARARSPNVPVPLRNEDGLSIMSEDFSFEDNTDRAPLASEIVYGEIARPSPGSDPVNDGPNEDVVAGCDPQLARTRSPVDLHGSPSGALEHAEEQIPPPDFSRFRMVLASVRDTILRPFSVRPPFLPWWP
ncbi:hypothetical protein NUW54_g7048 [Trametes sanguinea]|uniref:Uncharacterized protein n=1 Tax=Trametes sanguinea TaxID=158606 RepID=A0ACC1PQW4_9APHY|nr:hypothetical protein NUW54_g7048 [Trametes sanguinea]